MFTDTEKEYLRKIVKRELQDFKEEEKGVVDMSPAFLKGEKKFEDFLKELLEKLK